jgi:hypothetical protein
MRLRRKRARVLGGAKAKGPFRIRRGGGRAAAEFHRIWRLRVEVERGSGGLHGEGDGRVRGEGLFWY